MPSSRSTTKTALVALILSTLLSYGLAGYKASYTSECAKWKTDTDVCEKWSHSGTIDEDTSCFPAGTRLLTRHGLKLIEDLKINEEVLAWNPVSRKNEYSTIWLWLHRFPSMTHNYYRLQTMKGEVVASAFHNIAVVSNTSVPQISFRYALEIQPGFQLQGQTAGDRVIAVVQEEMKGLYAPYTRLGNFYVASPDQEKNRLYLVHSFANIQNPEWYHAPVTNLMQLAEWINYNVHRLPQDPEANYVHPVAKQLADWFPFLLDNVPAKYRFDDEHLTRVISSEKQEQKQKQKPRYLRSSSNSNQNNDNQRRQKTQVMALMTATLLNSSK